MKLLLLATALLSTFRPVDTAYNVGHFMLKERGSRGGRYCIGARDGEIVVDNRLIIEPCNELKTAQVWIIHDDDRGRIRAYDDPNLCIYIRTKTDSQTSRLAECDMTQKSRENKHNTAWDYNGSAKKYDELRVSSLFNDDEACTASDNGVEIEDIQCSDLCLTHVGNTLEDGDWIKTQNLDSKACDETEDELWKFGTPSELGFIYKELLEHLGNLGASW